MLDVDGIQVPGRVLGILRETTELQSVGLLIEVSGAPPGLGPGARLRVAVLTAERKGLLLPRDALLYDESGTYVYKQLTKKTGAELAARYAPVTVRLLLPYGDGWLIKVKVSDPADFEDLMDNDEYTELVAREKE